MALRKDDTKTIYVSYRIGSVNDGNEYSDPIEVKGQVVDTTGTTQYVDFGKSKDYDKTIYFETNKDTQYIDEYSKIWVDIVPTNNENPDYEIKHWEPVSKGMFCLFVKSIPTTNTKIYFVYNNKIYNNQLLFDNNKLIGTLKLNMFFPIDNNSIVWNRKPIDVNDTSNRIRLIEKKLVGDCYRLQFEKING